MKELSHTSKILHKKPAVGRIYRMGGGSDGSGHILSQKSEQASSADGPMPGTKLLGVVQQVSSVVVPRRGKRHAELNG